MTTEQIAQSRHPNEAFRRVILDMDATTAFERIQGHLDGLHAVQTARGYKLRDASGRVVAVISEYRRGPDEPGVRLTYRVGPSPMLSSVRRGRQVYEILHPHIW